MALSDTDRRFLNRRRDRTHIGLYFLPAAFLAVVVLWIGLFAYWPLAINPIHAAIYYEGMPIEKGTITTYAIIVTVLLNGLLFALGLALAFAVLWARSERRYLRLVAHLALEPKPKVEPKAIEPAK